MNTCDTCNCWKTDIDENGYGYDSYDSRLGTCRNPKHIYGYRRETSVKEDGVIIENDEGWGMFTGPKFGCVNWSAK